MSSLQLKLAFRDGLKALGVGGACAAAGGAALFLIGLIAGENGIPSGLEAAKDGLLVVASLGIFFLAGMLLVKGKKGDRQPDPGSWKKHFKLLGLKSVTMLLCLAFLAAAALADLLLMAVK